MRPLTPFVSYLDNDGHPLVGRVRFCNPDASPAEVFAEDGTTSLGSSVFTDSSGRPVQQPFLENHDYLLFFDKYVGHATMTEDDETDSWEPQGSAVDRYNTLGVALEAESLRTVDTVSSLRSTEALAEGEILVLLGYDEKGDKEPIGYVWDADSVEPDNGGSVIAVGGVHLGRWKFVECPRVLDVRHFGAFPGTSVVENVSQRYRIQYAGEYAHANGRKLFFPANDVESFYDISGLNLYDVDCDPSARVYAVSESHGTTITGITRIYCTSGISCKGEVRLVDETVRSSWEGESGSVHFAPTSRFIIDRQMNNSGVNFSDIEVEFLVYSRVYLERCRIISNKKINSYITLTGCVIDTSWFADDYDWRKLSSYDNVIRLHNCKDANTYITLKNKQGEKDYGDIGEQKVSEITLASGCIAENALFENVVLSGDSELHNVSGSVTISASATTQNWVDCWLSIGSDTVISNFSLRRGSVSGGKLSVLTSFLAHDAEIIVPIDLLGALPDVRRCKIACKVVQKDNAGVMSGTFESCTFDAEHELDPVSEGTVVNVVWRNNHATVNPVTIVDRSKLAVNESSHGYVYENNTGMFLPGQGEFSKDTTLTITDDLSVARMSGYVMGASLEYLGKDDIASIFFVNAINGAPHGITGVEFFRIGSDDFDVMCTWAPYETTGSVPYASNIVPQTFLMNMRKTYGNNNLYAACVKTYQSSDPDPDPVRPTIIAFLQCYYDAALVSLGAGTIKGRFKFSKV